MMLWSEFESLAEIHVSWDVYHDIVERMYMSLPDKINKLEFIQLLNLEHLQELSDTYQASE